MYTSSDLEATQTSKYKNSKEQHIMHYLRSTEYDIYREYYTVARRYEFYVRVARTISLPREKFISSSQRVMFFLLYGDFILNNKRDARNQFNKSKRRES